MKITMIGTGYVGLVTGACLAEVGNDVLCLDVDAAKIAVLNQGGVPIHEPGLAPMIARNMAAGRLRFTTDTGAAVTHGALQFIAVGTPPDEDGSADMQYVLAAARTRSAVPTGTVDLSTMILNSVMRVPMLRAAASTYCMSAEPSSSGGVPTAMNWTVPCATAASTSVVKASRPAATLRAIIASRPGSWIGTPPEFRMSILRASTSRHSTSLPTSARQVPVTRPT